jgi:hypothetical protein
MYPKTGKTETISNFYFPKCPKEAQKYIQGEEEVFAKDISKVGFVK